MADRHIENALAYLADHIEWALRRAGEKCESPIEQALFAGFVTLRLVDRRIRLMDMPTSGPILTEWSAEIHAQHQVEQYRLDFAIHITDGAKRSEWIAVECDGHDFHERTKEQASRDKARDRALTAMGFRVLRFTGSEIYRDNMACAIQVHEIIRSIGEAW